MWALRFLRNGNPHFEAYANTTFRDLPNLNHLFSVFVLSVIFSCHVKCHRDSSRGFFLLPSNNPRNRHWSLCLGLSLMALSVQFTGEEPLCGTIGQSAPYWIKCCHPALEEVQGGIVFWPSQLMTSRKSSGGGLTKPILACKNRCLNYIFSEMCSLFLWFVVLKENNKHRC